MSRKRSFLHSLNDAVEGFIYVIRHERNMRLHYLIAFFMLVLGVALGISRLEWIILCGTVTLVLVAEMMNTAIEETIDLVKDSFHPAARTIKHISAGMVLVTALNALIVAFFIFLKHLDGPIPFIVGKIRYANWYLTFITLLAVIFFVIAGKAFTKSGTPFRGGAVSGHTAIAFSLWTIIIYTTKDYFIIGLALLIAALVGQSRLRSKIHSLWEVVGGALIGVLGTSLFFKLFS